MFERVPTGEEGAGDVSVESLVDVPPFFMITGKDRSVSFFNLNEVRCIRVLSMDTVEIVYEDGSCEECTDLDSDSVKGVISFMRSVYLMTTRVVKTR